MADEEATAVAPNTAEQVATHEAAAAAWAKERKQPLWEVVLHGDEALWAARPGSHVAEEDQDVELSVNDEVVYSASHKAGDPLPWVAQAVANVRLRAATEDQAKARALAHNGEYHTVASIKQVDDGAPDTVDAPVAAPAEGAQA